MKNRLIFSTAAVIAAAVIIIGVYAMKLKPATENTGTPSAPPTSFKNGEVK